MNFEFENRWYSHYEILKLFQIREKTWKNWLYDNKTGKKKNLKATPIFMSRKMVNVKMITTKSQIFQMNDSITE